MIVLINIDSDITSRPLGMLARVLIDGVHYAQLIGDRRQVLIEDFDE